MKTLVYAVRQKGGLYFRDAALPGEAGPTENTAVFRPAHKVTGHNLDFRTMKSRPFTRHDPDSVVVGSCAYPLKRGICQMVRHGNPEALAEVAVIDEKIAHLEAEKKILYGLRQSALEDAYERGRPLRAGDIQQPTITVTPGAQAVIDQLAADLKKEPA